MRLVQVIVVTIIKICGGRFEVKEELVEGINKGCKVRPEHPCTK